VLFSDLPQTLERDGDLSPEKTKYMIEIQKNVIERNIMGNMNGRKIRHLGGWEEVQEYTAISQKLWEFLYSAFHKCPN
jgi:hypothetical protein